MDEATASIGPPKPHVSSGGARACLPMNRAAAGIGLSITAHLIEVLTACTTHPTAIDGASRKASPPERTTGNRYRGHGDRKGRPRQPEKWRRCWLGRVQKMA